MTMRFWIPTSDVCAPFASGQEELRAFLGDKYTGKSDDELIQQCRPRRAARRRR